jgi:hypothetical protein
MKADDRREPVFNAAESQTPSMCGNSMHGNRESPQVSSHDGGEKRSGKAICRTPDVYAGGQSDVPIVPEKRTNKTGTPAAESVEERGAPKGNVLPVLLVPDTEPECTRHRRQNTCDGYGQRDAALIATTQGRSRMR